MPNNFIHRIDNALGLNEAESEDPNATTSPALGSAPGISKGSAGSKYSDKQKKKKAKQIEQDVLTSG